MSFSTVAVANEVYINEVHFRKGFGRIRMCLEALEVIREMFYCLQLFTIQSILLACLQYN